MEKPQTYTITIISKEKAGEHIYFVRFALPVGQSLHFTAGQTVMFRVAPGVNRSMSIASPPSDTKEVLMCHDTSPMGPFSLWTIHAKVGDAIDIVGPLGMFTLDKESQRKKFLMATGTGIAPFRSMLLDVFESYQPRLAGRQVSAVSCQLALYWGLRHETDIYWNDEFSDLAKRFPNFHYYLTLSQPQPSWKGLTGRVTAHLDAIIDVNAEYYLCGSSGMIREVKQRLLDAHVPKEQIKNEAFFT